MSNSEAYAMKLEATVAALEAECKGLKALLLAAKGFLPRPSHNRAAMHDPELGCGRGCPHDDLAGLHKRIEAALAANAKGHSA